MGKRRPDAKWKGRLLVHEAKQIAEAEAQIAQAQATVKLLRSRANGRAQWARRKDLINPTRRKNYNVAAS